jgi:hypothetical protein
MAEKRIQRKDLWVRLNNIKKSQEWINAAEALGLRIATSGGGTSHSTIRDPKNLDNDDPKSLIATVQKNIYKQANHAIFKQLIKFGIPEEDIWKALRLRK